MSDDDFTTSDEAIQQIGTIILSNKLQSSLLHDLGSCRGYFVLSILKMCPDLRIIGIDSSRSRTWFAKFRGIFRVRATFKKADIFDTDVSTADLVYAYLPPDLLPVLMVKLQKELKPGALVLTYRTNFSGWQPSQTFLVDHKNPQEENVYMYRKI